MADPLVLLARPLEWTASGEGGLGEFLCRDFDAEKVGLGVFFSLILGHEWGIEVRQGVFQGKKWGLFRLECVYISRSLWVIQTARFWCNRSA